MRQLKLIYSDIRFQWKYGFYYLYIIITVLYVFALSLLHGEEKNKVGILMILSDPATMGMFFMGAIVLLEKSQRVIHSIAISPIKPGEYMISKIVSVGIISLIVGGVIIIAKGSNHFLLECFGVFMGSVLFFLCGLLVGANISTLNQYVIATMPFELLGFSLPIPYLFGIENNLMLLHPGCILVRFMSGNGEYFLSLTGILILWVMLLYIPAKKSVEKMFKKLGGES